MPVESDLKKRPTESRRLFFAPMLILSLNLNKSQSATRFVVVVDWMYSYWKRPSAAKYIDSSLLNGVRGHKEMVSFWSSTRLPNPEPENFVVLSSAPPKSTAEAGSTTAANNVAAIAILIEAFFILFPPKCHICPCSR